MNTVDNCLDVPNADQVGTIAKRVWGEGSAGGGGDELEVPTRSQLERQVALQLEVVVSRDFDSDDAT
jgi:hypothetical protein